VSVMLISLAGSNGVIYYIVLFISQSAILVCFAKYGQ